MADEREQLLAATLDRMLGMVTGERFKVGRSARRHTVVIAGATITLDPAAPLFELELERLALMIEAAVAVERASGMLAAAGAVTTHVPLWLVTGSSILARWLTWSRSEVALRRVLKLSNQADDAPVVGFLDRPARVALGQTPVKIRVGKGLAIATKIELPAQPRCVMALGRTARLTIAGGRLPEAVVAALAGRGMTELGSHPFFSAADLVIASARNEGQSLVVELEHEWRPLASVPQPALAVVPGDADAACPWRPTRQEIADLYALVDGLRRHGRQA